MDTVTVHLFTLTDTGVITGSGILADIQGRRNSAQVMDFCEEERHLASI